MFPFLFYVFCLLQYLYLGLHILFSCEIKDVNSSGLLFDGVELFRTDGKQTDMHFIKVKLISCRHYITVCNLVDIVIISLIVKYTILSVYILDNYTFWGIKLEKFSLQIVFQCNFDFIFVDLNRYHPFKAARYNLLPVEDVLFLEKGYSKYFRVDRKYPPLPPRPRYLKHECSFYSLVTGSSSQSNIQNGKG